MFNKPIRKSNSLKFKGMYPLVPVINKPLVFPRPANRADSSIHKPKTVVKGSTLVRHSIRVLLDSKWIQDGIIPGCDSVMMQIEDIVEHYVRYHTQNRNWFCKSADHVTVTTWICEATKKYAKALYSVANTALWTRKDGR